MHGSHFPSLRTASDNPHPESEVRLSVRGLEGSGGGFTADTMVRAAWSIVAARSTGSSEALFRATVTRRESIDIVPVRVSLDWESSISQLLQGVQRQAAEMAPFQQTGLQRIRRMSDEAALGCAFQTLLNVQPAVDVSGNQTRHRQSLGMCAMVIECRPETNGAHTICVRFDSDVVGQAQAARIAHHLEHVLGLLSTISSEERLQDVAVISQQDLDDIWSWNTTVPEPVEACVHDLISRQAYEQPFASAIDACDGTLTYGKLDELSTRLAYQLIAD